MRRLLPILLLAAAAASSCGGPPADERPTHFDLEPTRTCLRQSPDASVTTEGLDFVASTALGGAMRVTLPGNFVIVVFGETGDEATRIEQAYRQFAGEEIPIDDVLKRDQNVVMVWNAPPSPEHDSVVRGCLGASE